jgi:hypothetical protein
LPEAASAGAQAAESINPTPPRRPARVGHATTETAIPEGEFRHEGPTSLFIFSFSQFA